MVFFQTRLITRFWPKLNYHTLHIAGENTGFYMLCVPPYSLSFYLDGDHVVRFATPDEGFFRWGNLPGENIWAHADNAPFDNEVSQI